MLSITTTQSVDSSLSRRAIPVCIGWDPLEWRIERFVSHEYGVISDITFRASTVNLVFTVLVVMSWVMTTQGNYTITTKSTPTKSLGCHIHTCSTLISDAKVQIVPGMHLATNH